MDLDVRQRYPFFTGSKRHKKFPFAPGFPIHECVGQVSESTSSLFKPGEMVIAIPDGNQALAEYFVAQASKSVLLSPDLGNSDASCLIQPLSTVLNAVDRLGNIEGARLLWLDLAQQGCFSAGSYVSGGPGESWGSIRASTAVTWLKMLAQTMRIRCAASK